MVRFWESVDIIRLDEIYLAGGDYEWHPLNYNYIGDQKNPKVLR